MSYLWLENILKLFYFTCYWSIREKKNSGRPDKKTGTIISRASFIPCSWLTWLCPLPVPPSCCTFLPPWSPAPASHWLPPTYRIKSLSPVLIALTWVRRCFFLSNKSRIWKLRTTCYRCDSGVDGQLTFFFFSWQDPLRWRKSTACMSGPRGRIHGFFFSLHRKKHFKVINVDWTLHLNRENL